MSLRQLTNAYQQNKVEFYENIPNVFQTKATNYGFIRADKRFENINKNHKRILFLKFHRKLLTTAHSVSLNITCLLSDKIVHHQYLITIIALTLKVWNKMWCYIITNNMCNESDSVGIV